LSEQNMKLIIEVARPGKIFGAMRIIGDDLTAQFDPTQPDHMNLLGNGAVKLVKVDDSGAKPTAVTKRARK
jgi:hypothetical protein